MGSTKKPCHGCGSTFGRSTEGVCSDCQAALKLAKDTRTRAAEQPKLEERNLYRMWYGKEEGSTCCNAHNHQDRLEAAMTKVRARLLDVDAPGRPTHHSHDAKECPVENKRLEASYYDKTAQVLVNTDDAKLLDELDSAIRDFLRINYNTGLENGRSLLLQLAEGGITTDKFNELATRTMNKEKRYR